MNTGSRKIPYEKVGNLIPYLQPKKCQSDRRHPGVMHPLVNYCNGNETHHGNMLISPEMLDATAWLVGISLEIARATQDIRIT